MAKLKFSFPVFQQPPSVTFGRGSLVSIRDQLDLNETVFFVSGSENVRAALTRTIRKVSLPEERILTKPPGEPSVDSLKLGKEFLEKFNPTTIVGLGGGSVLDWCRLAWLNQQVEYQSGGFQLNDVKLSRSNFWLIPTTCATGAEAATVAVLNDNNVKIPVVTNAFLASRVILDAQFIDRFEASQFAEFLCDAISHCVESYTSIVHCALAEEAAVTALHTILSQFHGDGECRNERLMEASYLAGIAASHCSVGVVHAFAHSIASFGVTHARANAMGILAGIEANRECEALGTLANRLGLSSVDELASSIAKIVAAAKTRWSDKEIQLLEDDQATQQLVSAMSQDACLRTNPVRLSDDELNQYLDRVRHSA